jgi:hypothetical protein
VHLIALGLLVSCGGDGPTAPRKVAFDAGGTSITLNPTTSSETITKSADNYPNLTLIHVTVTGSETELYTSASNPSNPGAPTPHGTMDAGGYFFGGGCMANVDVSFGSTTVGYCQHTYPFDKWTIVQGQGTVAWNKRPQSLVNQCGGTLPPCYTYTGDGFTVSIDRPEVELVASADRYVTVPGKTSVTFTAQPSVGQFGGLGVPFVIQQWQWQYDSAGTPVAACLNPPANTNPARCTFSPTRSGSMTIIALVNGVQKTKVVHVRVLCKATGDSLLDSLPILDKLSEMEQAGGDSTILPQNRHEMAGVGGVDSMGEPWNASTPLPTACGGNWPYRLDTLPGIKWWGHTHPFFPAHRGFGGWFYHGTDTLPDNCGPVKTANAPAPGPSPRDVYNIDDWGNNSSVNAPHYIMDGEKIYIYPGGPMSQGDRFNTYKKEVSRKQGSCRII